MPKQGRSPTSYRMAKVFPFAYVRAAQRPGYSDIAVLALEKKTSYTMHMSRKSLTEIVFGTELTYENAYHKIPP